jgi:hypothetical protein
MSSLETIPWISSHVENSMPVLVPSNVSIEMQRGAAEFDGLINPFASHLSPVPEIEDTVLEKRRLIVEAMKETEIKPPIGALPSHNPSNRQYAVAEGSNEKPFNPDTSIFAIDEMASSFEGFMKKVRDDTPAAKTSFNSAMENTNSDSNTGGIKTFEKPVPTFDESWVPSSTTLAAAGCIGATTPVIKQLTAPSKDAATELRDSWRTSPDMYTEMLPPKGASPIKCTLEYVHEADAPRARLNPVMGCNDIVFVGISPDHSAKVNAIVALDGFPSTNLEANVTSAEAMMSLYITFDRAETEAMIVPLSSYADIVDNRP